MVRPLTELPVAAVPIHVDRMGLRLAGDCGFHLGLCWGTTRGSFVPGNQQAMIYIRCSEFDPAFKITPSQEPRELEWRPVHRISSRFGPKIRRQDPFRAKYRSKTSDAVVVRVGCGIHGRANFGLGDLPPSPALVSGERRSPPPVGLQTDLRTQFRHPDFSCLQLRPEGMVELGGGP